MASPPVSRSGTVPASEIVINTPAGAIGCDVDAEIDAGDDAAGEGWSPGPGATFGSFFQNGSVSNSSFNSSVSRVQFIFPTLFHGCPDWVPVGADPFHTAPGPDHIEGDALIRMTGTGENGPYQISFPAHVEYFSATKIEDLETWAKYSGYLITHGNGGLYRYRGWVDGNAACRDGLGTFWPQ